MFVKRMQGVFDKKVDTMYLAIMNIPDRIRESKKTDVQLSREVGVAVQVVWRWRRGLHLPSLKHVGALARSLDCGVRDLVPEEA